MKYAKEVMELMSCYPGRAFRMVEIVNYACPVPQTPRQRSAMREAIRVVLLQLIQSGTVVSDPRRKHGGYATYRWKVPDEVRQSASESARIVHPELYLYDSIPG